MVYRIWFFTLFIKLVLSAWYPLFQDEMYYWVWAQNPSLSYFDHPPFIAWLMKAGLPLDQFGSALRWPTVLFGHLSLLIWIAILRNRLSEGPLTLFVILFSVAPLTGLGSIIATPDVPLLVFWSLSVLCLIEAIETQKWQWFLALGIAAGFGFCSKYHMVLLLPLVLLYFFLTKQSSKQYLKLLVALGITVIFASPVIYWNFANDWASFEFQLQRGLGQKSEISWLFDYIGAQLALLLPAVLFAAWAGSKVKQNLLFAILGWGPLVFFLFSSLKGRVEPNWTAVAFPSLFYLAASAGEKWTKWLRINAAIWIFAFCLLISHLAFRWLPLDDKTLKLDEYYAFDEYLHFFRDYESVYASSYQMAATVSFKLRKPIYKLRGIHRRDHYDMLPQSLPKSDEFYLFQSSWNVYPDWLKQEYEHKDRIAGFHDYLFLNGFKKKRLE